MAQNSILTIVALQIPTNIRATVLANAISEVTQNNSCGLDAQNNAQHLVALYAMLEQTGSVQYDLLKLTRSSIITFFVEHISSLVTDSSTFLSLSLAPGGHNSLDKIFDDLLASRIRKEALKYLHTTFNEWEIHQHQSLLTGGNVSEEFSEVDVSPPDILHCLRYFEILFGHDCRATSHPDSSLIISIFTLVLTHDVDIAKSATRTFISIRSEAESMQLGKALASSHEYTWLVVSHLLTSDYQSSNPRNLGLTLWCHLASASCSSECIGFWMKQCSYYRNLALVLGNGTSEQQKLALAIFRTSITRQPPQSQTEKHRLEEQKTQYARFATVFETIVLVSHFNQVENCLQELKDLYKSSALVDPLWITMLLQAVFDKRFPSKIQKLVADWALQEAPGLISKSGILGISFFQKSLLPWAATGALYILSIFKSPDLEIHCMHGDRVDRFIQNLLAHSSFSNHLTGEILTAILSFSSDQGSRISSYALAYVLRAIKVAVEENNLCLNEGLVGRLQDSLFIEKSLIILRAYISTLILRLQLYAKPLLVTTNM